MIHNASQRPTPTSTPTRDIGHVPIRTPSAISTHGWRGSVNRTGDSTSTEGSTTPIITGAGHVLAQVCPLANSIESSNVEAASTSIDDDPAHQSVFNITLKDASGSTSNHRFALPRAAGTQPDSADLSFMEAKGVFSIPSKETCDVLIRNYLLHVHLWLPVVDMKNFLSQYNAGGPASLNLLLLWAVLLAGSSTLSDEDARLAGFSSRTAMGRSYFTRTKTLYDLNPNDNKIAVIQALIILAYWHQSDSDDITGSWHWLGLAISFCQTLGLHRDHKTVDQDADSVAVRLLSRRLWWICKARDTWLSLGFGRPMRIKPSKSEVAMPTPEQIASELLSLPLEVQQEFIPTDIEVLCRHFVQFLAMSRVLGDVLYRTSESELPPSLDELHAWENEFASLDHKNVHTGAGNFEDFSTNVKIAICHYEICYTGAHITIWRPYISQAPVELSVAEQEEWRKNADHKIRAIISRSSTAMAKCIDFEISRYLKHSTLTALLPIMQFLLLEIASSKPLARRLARQRFDLYLAILTEIKETYWQAATVFKFFQRALRHVLQQGQNLQYGNGDVDTNVAENAIHVQSDPAISRTDNNDEPQQWYDLESDGMDLSLPSTNLPWLVPQEWGLLQSVSTAQLLGVVDEAGLSETPVDDVDDV
ncbi:hypothetical protein BP5796_12009 [Coleophoma crateriformis]|uniref:Xylanolytic transcriptional activator regulatory domain-containing protein n=1 Tax=Coleophoma crateriformis TaxID=565419 RepID=A0A3D8QB63_9HELO|nr:hypothetical protein BP5796_12009 [Coleophoma crateriformis]